MAPGFDSPLVHFSCQKAKGVKEMIINFIVAGIIVFAMLGILKIAYDANKEK